MLNYKMFRHGFGLLAALLLISTVHGARKLYSEGVHELFSGVKSEDKFTGEVWALLIAGSAGWGNYRYGMLENDISAPIISVHVEMLILIPLQTSSGCIPCLSSTEEGWAGRRPHCRYAHQ